VDVVPKTTLVVEVTDHDTLISRELHEVLRPPGPVRQHEQLVRMVTGNLPDARVVSSRKGNVKLICRGCVITSAYEDALEPAAEPSQQLS